MTSCTFSLGQKLAHIDTLARQLTVGGTPARLGGRAFDLLLALVERNDRVVSKQELMDLVWPGLVVEEGNLHVHVFNLRRVLGADAIVTVPGRGYRFAGVIQAQGSDAGRAAEGGDVAQPLFGREALLDEVVGALRDATRRLVTLVGPGGAGKTRLAQEVVARVAPVRAGGAHVVMLASVRETRAVARAVIKALGQPDEHGSPQAALDAWLRDRETLLVLDNLEHLPEAARWANQLLKSAPQLQVLATSRTRLSLRDERVIHVPPLALPSGGSAQAILASPAVAMLMQQAAQQGHDLRGSQIDELRAAAQICRQLDGLPLAIELVAPRLRVMTPALLAGRLEQRLDLLTGGLIDTQAHHRSLREALAWSQDLLDAPAKQLFRRLGLFVGGCPLAAAEMLVGDRNLTWQALEQLMQHHLVQRAPDRGVEPRFMMLETVREFAQEALDAAGEQTICETARARWVSSWAAALQDQFQRGERALALAAYRADRSNVQGTLQWAFDVAADVLLQCHLVTHLVDAWDNDNDAKTGMHWFERIQLAAVPPTLRVGLLLGGAALANCLCRFDEASRLAEQAAELAHAIGDLRQQALAWCHQARAESNLDAALALLRRGQSQLQARGTAGDAALAQWSLGKRMAQEGGNDDQAMRLLADAGQRFAALGNHWMTGTARIQQALLLARRGERAAALSALTEGETLVIEHNDTFNVVSALHLRARFERDDGRVDTALRLQHEAVQLLLGSGEARVAVQHCRWMACLHELCGQPEAAVRMLATSQHRFGDVDFLSLTTVSAQERAEWRQTGQRLRETLAQEHFEEWWEASAPWTPTQALMHSVAVLAG